MNSRRPNLLVRIWQKVAKMHSFQPRNWFQFPSKTWKKPWNFRHEGFPVCSSKLGNVGKIGIVGNPTLEPGNIGNPSSETWISALKTLDFHVFQVPSSEFPYLTWNIWIKPWKYPIFKKHYFLVGKLIILKADNEILEEHLFTFTIFMSYSVAFIVSFY